MRTVSLLVGGVLALAGPISAQRIDDIAVRYSTAVDSVGLASAGWKPNPSDSALVVQAEPFCCSEPHFVWTAIEIAALQVMPWYFNRHVADDSTAKLSLDVWKRNLSEGFEWDPNNFTTNMFMHPYHGSAYFNAARSNGYNYWESVAFSWMGSLIWEFFAEDNRGAINDWINTSLGGSTVGEGLYRASLAITDNTKTGFDRWWREMVGFAVNPIRSANRMFRGETSRVGPNPPDSLRYPRGSHVAVRTGLRHVGDGNLGGGTTGAFLEIDFLYGDPFRKDKGAFDAFQIIFQINTRDRAVGRFQIEGILFGTELQGQGRWRRAFNITQHYDYINTEAYEIGGQSVGASMLWRYRSGNWGVGFKFQPTAAVISAISSEYAEQTGRSYDFGSGAGLRTYATVNKSGIDFAQLFYIFVWSHSLNGAAGDHFIHFFGARAETPQVQVPFFRHVGAGAQFIYAARESKYRDFPDVSRRNPQFRVYMTLF